MPDEKSPNQKQAADETEVRIAAPSGTASKSSLSPAVALAFVTIALLGVLIVMVLKNSTWRSSSGDADVSALQAEANALRSEYNRERVAMGLRPVEGDSEAIEEVAGRVKKDADTLVALATSYQRMLEAGVAREVARAVLPVTLYSSMYVTMNARSLMNFLSLRTKREGTHFPSFPQREIEMVAEKMEALWEPLMPMTAATFSANGRVAP